MQGPWRCVDLRTGVSTDWSYAASGVLTLHGYVRATVRRRTPRTIAAPTGRQARRAAGVRRSRSSRADPSRRRRPSCCRACGTATSAASTTGRRLTADCPKPAAISAPARRLAQRLEERDQRVDVVLVEPEGLQDPFAVCMQPVHVEIRVVAHDVAQRREAAVWCMYGAVRATPRSVGTGIRRSCGARARRGAYWSPCARWIVVVRAQQVVPACL